MTEHALAAAGGVLGGALVIWLAWDRHWKALERLTAHA